MRPACICLGRSLPPTRKSGATNVGRKTISLDVACIRFRLSFTPPDDEDRGRAMAARHDITVIDGGTQKGLGLAMASLRWAGHLARAPRGGGGQHAHLRTVGWIDGCPRCIMKWVMPHEDLTEHCPAHVYRLQASMQFRLQCHAIQTIACNSDYRLASTPASQQGFRTPRVPSVRLTTNSRHQPHLLGVG